MSNAKAYIIGAGPGDPKLLTMRGAEVVSRADVIVYDRLVHPSILTLAKPDALLVYVGKASSCHIMKQEDINRLLVEKAKTGKTVARLKGGDPFVFGRGGEEALALFDAGIDFEIIPGVTSAVAAPACAGIPVTHRGIATSFAVITGHEDPEKGGSGIDWAKISTATDTLVILMGVENLPDIVRELIENGRSRKTPAALIRWGTRADQKTLTGTLDPIASQAKKAGFESPAVIVVGEVVTLRDKLAWFEKRPLFGKRIVVTRSRDQASALSEKLRDLGADVVEFPVIRIEPVVDPGFRVSELVKDAFDWIIFTSANGVECLVKRLLDLGLDVRALAGAKLAAIGPATSGALRKYGLRVDYVPEEFVAEAVVEGFPEDPSGKRILIPRAREARDVLPERLAEMGAEVKVVSVYETIIEDACASVLFEGKIDAVTFTSSSTVRNFAELLGDARLPDGVAIACIGPVTAETARRAGFNPTLIAEQYTIDGLIDALLNRQADARHAASDT